MKKLQESIDSLIYKIVGRIIPNKVKPNHITFVRFFLVFILAILLVKNELLLGLVVFIFAALSDVIDGTVARKRNQITDLGKMIDPLADKLLIGTALFFIGFEHLVVKIFLIFIVFEIVGNILAYTRRHTVGKTLGANIFGKIKMVLQSIAVVIFVLGYIFENNNLINSSIIILVIALVFAVLSAFKQLRDHAKINKKQIPQT